jgi:hypothetical protein
VRHGVFGRYFLEYITHIFTQNCTYKTSDWFNIHGSRLLFMTKWCNLKAISIISLKYSSQEESRSSGYLIYLMFGFDVPWE